MSWILGAPVNCTTCGRRKKPIGRSAPLAMANGLCDSDYPGYTMHPYPGDLWPGETRAEFGYPKACPVCETPIQITAAALAKARKALRKAASYLSRQGHLTSAAECREALAALGDPEGDK